jgi:hypothetical protein
MDEKPPVSDIRSVLHGILATKFPFLIIFVIILGIIATVLINRLDYAIRALIYLVPGLLAAVFIWYLYRRQEKYPPTLTLMRVHRQLFWILFVVLYACSLLALYFSPTRPWYYFVLLTLMFCCIFLQIFSDTQKPSIILFEISCVMGNLMFGLHLKYPLFFGLTDIIPHLYLSTITFLSGHIVPVDLDYSYAWFPLYHIFIAEGTNLMGIDIKTVFILLTSLSFIVLLWLVYLLFYQITENTQTSLLVSLFFATTPVAITYSTYVVTRVMAFFGFIFFLYLAHKRVHTSKWRAFTGIIILFSLYLILVHQVSIIQIIFLLVIFAGLEILINDYYAITTKIIAFIIVTSTTYWLYTSFFLTSILLQTVDSATIPKLSETMSQINPGNEFIFLENNLTTAIIIFFVIAGAGYLCWAYKSKYPAVIALFALITSPLYFPSPLTASAMAMITFRIDRFSLLISPFIACALAIGMIVLLFTLSRNTYAKKGALLVGVVIFAYLCYSALTVENAMDSLDIAPHEGRTFFTEPELSAFDFIPQFAPTNSTITSDRFAYRMFEKRWFSGTADLGLPAYSPTFKLQSVDIFTYDEGYFVLRDEELKRSGLGFESMSLDYPEAFKPTEDNLFKFSNLSSTSQKIYDNRKASILTYWE